MKRVFTGFQYLSAVTQRFERIRVLESCLLPFMRSTAYKWDMMKAIIAFSK
jgi:hypothetical protein